MSLDLRVKSSSILYTKNGYIYMNRITLLIDGNWLLMSKIYSHSKGLSKQSTSPDKAYKSLINSMLESVESTYNYLGCDNILLVSDGGSWRKSIKLPDHHGDVYKSNRQKDSDLDWDLIYKAYDEFKTIIRDKGYTQCQGYGIEGDDWMWYWTNYLSSRDIHSIIWSTDHDLRQLVRKDKGCVAWYDGKNFVLNKSMDSSDLLEFMMNGVSPFDHILVNKLYINPYDVVIGKILGGDDGDNVKSIIRYKKGTRTYKFSEKDIISLRKDIELNIPTDPRDKKSEIANWILSNKKFEKYEFVKEHIEDMIELNTRLVWLDESVYPDTVLSQFVVEYKSKGKWVPQEINFEEIFG